jgi:hypothetical protein
MRKTFLFIFAITPMVLALGGFTLAQKDMAKMKPMTMNIDLKGSAEVPGPGDTDGSGKAKVTINHGKGEICYDLTVKNIDKPTMAHIHAGAAGTAGDVKVKFESAADGSWKGCATVDHAVLEEITKNPANFYVNVHNTEFPNGAVRGQLGK